MINEKKYELGAVRSCIRELFEYGIAQRDVVGRENVFDYSIGNPSVPTPGEIKEAAKDLLETEPLKHLHGYTRASGTPALVKAIADDLNERYNAGIRSDNIFITCGAAPALTAAISALSVEGAEIITILPIFPEYKIFIEHNGCSMVTVPADKEHFQVDLKALEDRITQHTQAVIVNSPNNPSGTVYTRQTLEKLAEILTRKSKEIGHPIYILADEPYRELAYDGVEVSFIPNIYPNTVVCYSYSKSLSMPGDRLGYFLVPDQCEDGEKLFMAAAGAARAMGHVCAPAMIQKIVSRCAYLRPDIEAYDKNRTTLYNALIEYGYECPKPEGAFYIFVKAPGGNSKAFSDYCKKKNLLVVPGDDFGCSDYFRLCTAVSHDMILRSLPLFKEAIEAFKA